MDTLQLVDFEFLPHYNRWNYDIYIANPSKYPEIKDVSESHMYHTEGCIGDNWKDGEGNKGYAVFEIYKDQKTGELDSKLATVHTHKKMPKWRRKLN